MSNKNGFIFGSPPGLANRARVPLQAVLEALEKFQKPDQYSRTKDFEGRRVEEVDGGWRLLNYHKHRAIRDEEERKEYLKLYMRQYRKRDELTNVNNVNTGKPQLSQAEAEAEAEAIQDQIHSARKARTSRFTIPSIGEVQAYCTERKNTVDAQQWFNFYTSNGWKVGRNSMKDWRAAVRTWEKNSYGGNQAKRVVEPRDAVKIARQQLEEQRATGN